MFEVLWKRYMQNHQEIKQLTAEATVENRKDSPVGGNLEQTPPTWRGWSHFFRQVAGAK